MLLRGRDQEEEEVVEVLLEERSGAEETIDRAEAVAPENINNVCHLIPHS